ncbi:hypothetical protein ACSFA0_23455 [Variovorax sp. LT1P1]|uniref:hypothetical protein n=1 Tax=Variovorax sp. LT1P1 TaxID=3443730 RepID=UPI003F48EDE7
MNAARIKALADEYYALKLKADAIWAEEVQPELDAATTVEQLRETLSAVSYACASPQMQIREMPFFWAVSFAVAMSGRSTPSAVPQRSPGATRV